MLGAKQSNRVAEKVCPPGTWTREDKQHLLNESLPFALGVEPRPSFRGVHDFYFFDPFLLLEC